MKKQIIIVCLVMISLFPSIVFASPVINEFSSSASDDWIEIYNPDTTPIDLSVFRIRDSTENNKLDLSGNLMPQGFMVFDWANKLNNGGDFIKLVLISDNSSIDQITYGNQGGLIAPDVNQSAGRITDGASNWTVFSSASKGSSNNSSSVFTPLTPTSTPSKIPTPTKIPQAFKISTNQPTKTPIPTRIISAASMVSVIPTRPSSNNNNSDKIAQAFKSSNYTTIRNLTITPEVSGKNEVLGAADRKIPVISIFGGIFLILAGVAAFSLKYVSIQDLYEKLFNK